MKYKKWFIFNSKDNTTIVRQLHLRGKNNSGYWSPCYIGQTENLGDRLENHEKEACAKRNGATHIHVHGNGSGEKARKAEEKDLILKWQPPCNDQHVG